MSFRFRKLSKLLCYLVIAGLLNSLTVIVMATEGPSPTASWYGDGSASYFEIGTAEELWELSQLTNPAHAGDPITFDGKTITLTANIDLIGYANGEGWLPIGSGINGGCFMGTFDGGGHTIGNLTVNRGASDDVGLFGYVTGGAIRNLTLKDVNITGARNAGGLAGNISPAVASVLIENVCVTGGVTSMYGNAGGIAGVAGNSGSLTIRNCYSFVNVISYGSNAGGIIGSSQGSAAPGCVIETCYTLGSVEGSNNVGGIVGNGDAGGMQTRLEITDCYAVNEYILADSGSNCGRIFGGILPAGTEIALSGNFAFGGMRIKSSATGGSWNLIDGGTAAGRNGIPVTAAEIGSAAAWAWGLFPGAAWTIAAGVPPILKAIQAASQISAYPAYLADGGGGNPVVPEEPENLTATAGIRQVTLTWQAIEDAGSYKLYYGTAAGVYDSAIPVNGGTAYTVAGLTNGTTYYFAVTTIKGAGESVKSAEVTATPRAAVVAPAAPTGFAAVAGDGKVTLSWTAVPGATEYRVYQNTTNDSNFTQLPGPITATSLDVNGLTNETTYYFKVSAVVGGLESQAALATATPKTPSGTGQGGSGTPPKTTQPVLVDINVYTNHKGAAQNINGVGTDDQYIVAEMTFDQGLKLAAGAVNDLAIRLNGAASPGGDTYNGQSSPNVGNLSYNQLTTLEAIGNTLRAEIHLPFAQFAGRLTISAIANPTRITNMDGIPIAGFETIDLYVPNGVQLITVSQIAATTSQNASVSKRVVADPSTTRSMVHMLLLKDGSPVGSVNTYGANITAHYHDYLALNASSFAPLAAGAINIPGFTATSSGDIITVTAAGSATGDVLDLLIWAWPRDGQSDANTSALSSSIAQAKAAVETNYSAVAYAALKNQIAVSEAIVKGSRYYLQSEISEAASALQAAINDKTGTTAAPPKETGDDSSTREIETTVTASVDENGIATVNVDSDQITAALGDVDKQSGERIALTLAVGLPQGSVGLVLTMPKSAVNTAVSGGADALAITSALGAISFDAKALHTISTTGATNGDVIISVIPADVSGLSDAARAEIGGRPVYDISVTAGGVNVSDFKGGAVLVSIPYTLGSGEDPNSIIIYCIAANGTLTKIVNCMYDAAAKAVKFKTTHLSVYSVGHTKVSFNDVVSGWYAEHVSYLSARGIVNGVGKGNFAPGKTFTRAEIVTMLARIAGVNVKNADSTSFTDVGTSDWYAGAVQWAYENGIVTGYGGKFDPDGAITRQDLATILMRFASLFPFYALRARTAAVTFTDAGDIAAYAAAAVSAVQRAGIIGGYADGSFKPTGIATRSEAAKMIALFIQGSL